MIQAINWPVVTNFTLLQHHNSCTTATKDFVYTGHKSMRTEPAVSNL
jgi:hypothetical protein